jgi:xanthine dehydrogenase accessory factor
MTLYQALADLEVSGGSAALCIIVRTSGSTPRHETSKMIVFPDGSIIGTVGGGEVENRVKLEALAALNDGKTRFLHYDLVNPQQGDPGICGGAMEVYVEPILPKPSLLIVGGGHVGKAVAKLGKYIGFQVIVADDRPEMCSVDENPDAEKIICCEMSLLPENFKITPQTYVVVTTRGSDVDIEGLPAILNTNPRYLGVIGSKRRWATTQKGLLAQGIPPEIVNRAICPIGLYIGAETPEEIAVSILAEILMVKNGIPINRSDRLE